ncbi:hypothetical protein CR513_27132, partial [Mucuna pruriens]
MEAMNLGLCKFTWGSVSKNLTRTKRRMVRRRCELGGGDKKDYRWGRLVDENMIVLRLRIKEMKMLEANEEVPSHWMEWEKQYCADYDKHTKCGIGHVSPYSFQSSHVFRGELMSCPRCFRLKVRPTLEIFS